MAHQRDCSGFDSHIAAAAHGNPHFGLRKRRRIVYPVTDHSDLAALLLQLFNRFGFAIRQYTCNHFVDACFFSDGVSGSWVIASQHHQAITVTM
ncbi:hypothetical protein D3C75_1030640 [compost metagenome]